jgi:hypothetical protein
MLPANRRLLRPALLGALLITLLTLSASTAIAIPKDGTPPLPNPPAQPPAHAPDLVVESFSYGSINFSVGKYYYVDVKVRNQGNLAAGEFWIRNEPVLPMPTAR